MQLDYIDSVSYCQLNSSSPQTVYLFFLNTTSLTQQETFIARKGINFHSLAKAPLCKVGRKLALLETHVMSSVTAAY